MRTRKDFKQMLLGAGLKNDQLTGEKLSKLWGLPIMASDAVSSVAYAVEEILMALVPLLGLTLLAANTTYNGLPILLSILAKDRYMPHQFT